MTTISRSNVKRVLGVTMALYGLASMGAATIPSTTWPPPPPMPVPCSSYCYNVDITNNTPTSANDLHVTLLGPTSICSYYTGDLNPFGKPVANVVDNNRIELHFASSTQWVKSGDIAHIGFCTNSPVTGMVTGHTNASLPPFYWTRQRVFSGDVVAVSHAWEAVRADVGLSPVITVINTTTKPLHVRQVDWAVVNQPIELNNLMWNGLEGALEWQPLLQDAMLPNGSEDAPGWLRMPIPFTFDKGDPRHIVFRVWAEDPKDPKNMNRGLSQASLSALAVQDK